MGDSDNDLASRPNGFRFWPSFAFHAVVFALLMGTFYVVDEGRITTRVVIQTVISGLVFGTLMAFFHRWWGQRRSA